MKKVFLCFIILSLAIHLGFANSLTVEKVVDGNFTTGNYVTISYFFYNPTHQTLHAYLHDNIVFDNSGVELSCLELFIPPNTSYFELPQKVLLTSPGIFNISAPKIDVNVSNISYIVKPKIINVSGTPVSGNYISHIYNCDGVKRTYTSYSSSSATQITISNGNVYVNTNIDQNLPDFDEIDKYFQQQVDQMHKHMQHVINSMFPSQPQYTPIINNPSKSSSPNSIQKQNSQVNPQSKNSQEFQKIINPQNAIKQKNFWWIKLLLILIIITLIIVFVKLSSVKSQTELEEVEDSKAMQDYRLIKSMIKELNKIRKNKKRYLSFKDLVARFKDEIIEEFPEINSEIIDLIDYYLYADDLNALDQVIKKLDNLFLE